MHRIDLQRLLLHNAFHLARQNVRGGGQLLHHDSHHFGGLHLAVLVNAVELHSKAVDVLPAPVPDAAQAFRYLFDALLRLCTQLLGVDLHLVKQLAHLGVRLLHALAHPFQGLLRPGLALLGEGVHLALKQPDCSVVPCLPAGQERLLPREPFLLARGVLDGWQHHVRTVAAELRHEPLPHHDAPQGRQRPRPRGIHVGELLFLLVEVSGLTVRLRLPL
mmetsp:Transcript_82700/g.215857  ORF Transcript_82700/g.215857 Transcript_82700/m.215857 type:complete len:219 (-) Transcript_82700:231-887(-)